MGLAILIGGCLSGCATHNLQGDSPPNVFIEITNENYPTKLGTYCWNEVCVDTAGPIDMLTDSDMIKVIPGEDIQFVMDFEPPPTTIELTEFRGNEGEVNVGLQNLHFTAPTQKGIYYYSYWLRWQKDNISIGDAYYAFALEVN